MHILGLFSAVEMRLLSQKMMLMVASFALFLGV
jgi:hypothetical protein